jgi:hypothetical protein
MAKHLYCIIHIYEEHKRNSYDTLMQDKNSHKNYKTKQQSTWSNN